MKVKNIQITNQFFKIIAIAVVYFITARLSFTFAYTGTNASPVWLPSGIAFATILILGYRIWPAIFLGALMVNFQVLYIDGHSLLQIFPISFFTAIGNTLEAVVGTYLVHKFTNSHNFLDKTKEIIVFLLISFIAVIISAVIGTLIFCVVTNNWDVFEKMLINWCIGDLMGILLVTPVILFWKHKQFQEWNSSKKLEFVLFLFILLWFIYFIAITNYPLKFMLVPILLWSAFRFGRFETSAILLFASLLVVSINFFYNKSGYVLHVNRVLISQLYFGAIAITFLFVNAALYEGHKSKRQAIDSEKRLKIIFESVNDAIFIHDKETGEILDVNTKVEKMLGFSKEEIVKMNVGQFSSGIHPYTQTEAINWIKKCDAEGSQVFEWQMKTKLGELVWGEVHMQKVVIEDKERILINLNDITHRKIVEDEIRQTNLELRILNNLIIESVGKKDIESILKMGLEDALKISNLEGGTVCTVTSDQHLHLIDEKNNSEETINDLTTNVIKVGECLCGNCALTKKPLILKNQQEVLAYATRESLQGIDIRFHAAFPIVSRQKSLGVLCVFNYSDIKPTEKSLDMVKTLTNQMALVIDNVLLYKELKKQLNSSQNEIHVRKRAEEKLINLKNNLKQLVNERTEELELKIKELDRMNKLFVGREIRMAELKREIEVLKRNKNDRT